MVAHDAEVEVERDALPLTTLKRVLVSETRETLSSSEASREETEESFRCSEYCRDARQHKATAGQSERVTLTVMYKYMSP